jgi:hypothetical protein
MTAQLEADADTALFTTMMLDVNLDDAEPEQTGTWASETKLHVLAYELASYMPELADQLAAAGRDRLLVA